MASTEYNITCPKCEIVLRPPLKTCRGGHLLCKNCKEHINAISGESVGSGKCGNNQYPMPLLNKLLKNPSDECQYGCGHRANVVDLTDHEEACLLRCKCAVYSCPWLGGLAKVTKHVEDDHPGVFVDASAVENDFALGFEEPVLLMTQLNKTSPNNVFYWLRLHKNKNGQFIAMQYQGQIGRKMDKEFLMKEYSVSPVNYPKLCINSEVIFTNSKEDNILEDKFVESQGTDVTVFKSDTFLVKIKDVLSPSTETKDVSPASTETLECFICLEIMSGAIKICVTGHSFCETCCKKLKNKCPKCQKEVKGFARNYALEEVVENVLKRKENFKKEKSTLTEFLCWYIDSGCKFKSRTGVDGHVKECEYQPGRCFHEVQKNYRCVWEGSHKKYLEHIKISHAESVKNIVLDATFTLSDNANNCNYFFYDNNCFLFRTEEGTSSNEYNVYFCQLTTKAESNYNFELRIAFNANTALFSSLSGVERLNFQGRCHPHTRCKPAGVISKQSSMYTMVVFISRRGP